jgi:hypothetical protein
MAPSTFILHRVGVNASSSPIGGSVARAIVLRRATLHLGEPGTRMPRVLAVPATGLPPAAAIAMRSGSVTAASAREWQSISDDGERPGPHWSRID